LEDEDVKKEKMRKRKKRLDFGVIGVVAALCRWSIRCDGLWRGRELTWQLAQSREA
jgi:hypothetical protein